MGLVHELVVQIHEGNLVYPTPVTSIRLGLFTTIEKGEAHLRTQLAADDHPEWDRNQVVHFTLEEIAVDTAANFRRRRYYDPTGSLVGEIEEAKLYEPFLGRDLSTCRFHYGDLVHFVYRGHLQLGMVTAPPLSPEEAAKFMKHWEVLGYEDCYLVLIGAEDHDHPSECKLSFATGHIDPNTRTVLLERLRGFPDKRAKRVHDS